MGMEIFKDITYFKQTEFDYPENIDTTSLLMLDRMRHIEGGIKDIFICVNADFAYEGHSKNSWHYRGKAFDISILDRKTKEPLPILEQYIMVTRYFFTGIGVYPYWNRPGLHIDTRPMTIYSRRIFWWLGKDGKYNNNMNEFMKDREVIQ